VTTAAPEHRRQLRTPAEVDALVKDFPALAEPHVRSTLHRETAERGGAEVLVDDTGRGYRWTGR
jgi:hypothetical protein